MADETARLTADVVLLARGGVGELCVLLSRRGWPPFEGCWALPGGHVDAGEDTRDAAGRELLEETGLLHFGLDLIGVYAAPARDPRARYVTFAYTGVLPVLVEPVAGDDATAARWWPVDEVFAASHLIAFDHCQILRDSLKELY